MGPPRIPDLGQRRGVSKRLWCFLFTGWRRGSCAWSADANGNFSASPLRNAMKEQFTFPELSLVVLIGASGSGKSTFARKHFRPTEVISSDYCRALVADDENDQAATNDAFDVLHFIAAKRLAAGRLTVVDATNVQS